MENGFKNTITSWCRYIDMDYIDYIDDWDKQERCKDQNALIREHALLTQLLNCNKKEKPTCYYYYSKKSLSTEI